MINNRQVGRRRGRNNPRQGGGGGGGNNRGNGDSGNRIDNRARGNAAQLLEKYRNLARDAQMAGDRVNVEYYLQFADHYFRVLADNRMRQEEQQGGRPRQSNERDQYNGPESSDGDYMNDGMGDDMDDISPRQQDNRQQDSRQQEPRQQEQRPRRDQRDDDGQSRQQDSRQQDRRPRNDQRDDDTQPRQQEFRQQEQRPRRDQRDDEAQPRQQQDSRQQDRRPRNDQRDDDAQPRQQEQRPRSIACEDEAAPRAAEARPRREPREKAPRVERVVRPRPVNDDLENDGEVEIGLPGLPPSIARVEIDEPQLSAEPAADVAEAPAKPRRGRPPRRAAEAAE